MELSERAESAFPMPSSVVHVEYASPVKLLLS